MKWEKETTSSGVTAVGQLIARLTLDAKLYQRYLKNPKGVIGKIGLSKKERKALLSGDWSRILLFLGPGKPATGTGDEPYKGGG